MSGDDAGEAPKAEPFSCGRAVGPLGLVADMAGRVVLTTDAVPEAECDRVVLLAATVRWDCREDCSELWLCWRRGGSPGIPSGPRLPELGRLAVELGKGLTVVVAHDLLGAGPSARYELHAASSGHRRRFTLESVKVRLDVVDASTPVSLLTILTSSGGGLAELLARALGRTAAPDAQEAPGEAHGLEDMPGAEGPLSGPS